MSIISSRFLMKFLDSISSYCVPIEAESSIYVVDSNGFIGLDVTGKFNYVASSYHYAIKVEGANFASLGLGKVTFVNLADDWIGGRKYKVVTIGGKEWLAENLDYKFDGLTVVDTLRDAPSISACYYDFDENTYGVNGNKYGLLYRGSAIEWMQNNKNTLFPGWHVAQAQDWTDLIKAIINNDGNISGNGIQQDLCSQLKSTSGWNDYTDSGQTHSGNGLNTTELNFKPAGYADNLFRSVGVNARYYSFYKNSSSQWGNVYISYNNRIYINNSSYYSNSWTFLPVRLVKDTY